MDTFDERLSGLCAAITSCGASPLQFPFGPRLGPQSGGLGAWNPRRTKNCRQLEESDITSGERSHIAPI
ncbi:Hypothetical protein SMAX5B_019258 [Scophthalmus maximus]|uniref:Uncharacterized protein n=1 Tax=Scophthalmus maximus TaxID=52904 RepID=A0A2U9B318_SCOMX|nr:Hypothetical protein SMAX5B_019258 [Scophthalmus maximus]